MANNVVAQVQGGNKVVLDDVNTVGEVAAKLNASEGYAASVNGDSASFSDELEDSDVVTFAKAVKGGAQATKKTKTKTKIRKATK